jgi:hypothetical protein
MEEETAEENMDGVDEKINEMDADEERDYTNKRRAESSQPEEVQDCRKCVWSLASRS